ncbi:F-actin-capping protein subunit alpha [Meloidogyne graminicola]|uniref:F-actin-capping protein subunit alpha n=1 Tax=Meloidogyne graminicola TaxID=189291 RepID=A0A8S9Z7J8_9BILA|nr:F-actin-capping protein subunit alpha [Meloidogyne graminicola]
MIGAELTDAEKFRIVSDFFLLQSPPGEFNEVFNDVRTLLNDDILLEKGCLEAIKQYNRSQFVSVKLDGVEQATLVTEHNEMSDGRFVDPKSQKIFKYDHLRKEAVETHPISKEIDDKHEQWRKILQKGIG